VLAFAAGSGITPILSIAQSVLNDHAENKFVLVFGNRTPEETMYREELQGLIEQHPNRFLLVPLYSRSHEEDSLFGRIDASTVNYITKNKYADLNFSKTYLCGPEAMINEVSKTLIDQGIPEEKVLFELFTATEKEDTLVEVLEGTTNVKVILDDESFSFAMDQKKFVLDAALKEKIDVPYSCQGGVCSSCIARIKVGEAKMVNNQILTDGEIAEGLILTCQAHPTTPTLTVDYDDV
jgi:ring-1,2-phenylacetyl-CoA epoxidase subunit PaaE